MGKAQRQKGSRVERRMAALLNDAGIETKRVDAKRGQLGSDESYDLVLDNTITAEVKARANGFKQDYKWLADNDLLIKVADRQYPIVTMSLDTFTKLWKGDRHHEIPERDQGC